MFTLLWLTGWFLAVLVNNTEFTCGEGTSFLEILICFSFWPLILPAYVVIKMSDLFEWLDKKRLFVKKK